VRFVRGYNSRQIRQERIDRLRRRLTKIKPEDGDMIELVGAVKGMLDVIADDGEECR
jgi:hypothetical protein